MRLFIAATFPSGVLGDLNERVARIRSRLPPAAWARPETQHLTFAFLGDQPEPVVEDLSSALTPALAAIPKFEARIHSSGLFPNARHARVGWAGLQPDQPFQDVAKAVRGVVTQKGIALDNGDFKPHLTLMRMREGWPPSSIELFTKSLKDFQSALFEVSAITLFSSQLDPKGAIHTPLKAFALKG